jgi:hypothetical protein
MFRNRNFNSERFFFETSSITLVCSEFFYRGVVCGEPGLIKTACPWNGPNGRQGKEKLEGGLGTEFRGCALVSPNSIPNAFPDEAWQDEAIGRVGKGLCRV